VNFRFRPTLTPLEARENPSVPGLDPFGGVAPAPVDPPAVPFDPAQIAIDAVIAGAASVPPTTPLVPADGINSVYKIPLLP